MTKEIVVAKASEIKPGQCKQVEIDGDPIGIYNIEGEFFAIADTCSHASATLTEGSLEGHVITCPWHGARFDVKTGKNLSMPAPVPVPTYTVKIDGDDIKIVL